MKDKSTASEGVTEGTEAAMTDLGGTISTGESLYNVELVEGAAARCTG
jgi:hypothetical protein